MSGRRRARGVLGIAAVLAPAVAFAWQPLAPGMDLETIAVTGAVAADGGRITVLRFDPRRWEMDLVGTSETGEGTGRTARAWAREHRLAAAINAGMFATDYRTHVGYMRSGEHVNSPRVNSYLSVAAFNPRREGLAPFRIFDLDQPGVAMPSILEDYASAVQNLRLVKRPGENRWSKQEKRWSEAALGEDEVGRVLFIFCRTPLAMQELNRQLLAAGIGLVAAQHLEGGPEAQLYFRAGDIERELFGSFETSLREDDGNPVAWPVPNVLGVRPRRPER